MKILLATARGIMHIHKDLRDRPRPPAESGLDAWNAQLVHFGAPIFEKRRFYIERLAPIADRIHRDLTDGKEGLEIRYLPSIPLPAPLPPKQETPDAVLEATAEERYLTQAQAESAVESDAPIAPESPLSGTQAIESAFHKQLSLVAADEARRGTTLLGPQRDDIGFFINGNEARIYGSQGQQRTVVLALKLAEFQLIEDYVGEPPVMLLDDVMSDLDDVRRKRLLAWVRRRCQTFVTCTNLRAFPKEILAEATTFHVVAGTVTPDGPRKTRSSKELPTVESPAVATAAPSGESAADSAS